MSILTVKIQKRNGSIEDFVVGKIVDAVRKANLSVDENHRINEYDFLDILDKILLDIELLQKDVVNVEEVQDIVEVAINSYSYYHVSKAYITYRYQRELTRKIKERNKGVLQLVSGTNKELNEENSNKNPQLVSTQRDYMAGEVSKDIALNLMLPKDIVDAHKKGIIWVHDLDYYCNNMFNCCLCNLEDMLQNGTVISGTMIEKPHSFHTACTIATQIITQVSSGQFGGQTITLSHLAPFVDVSRKKIRQEVLTDFCEVSNSAIKENDIEKLVEKKLRKEIRQGVQTIQYQLITMSTTNGQAPFITMFMYLNEVTDPQTKHDLALIIEEVLRQRIVGVKNEKGVYITTAFPKLIYVLQEDNITEDGKYWYLTKLAMKCSIKRFVPDYISEKVMREIKEGYCFGAMGKWIAHVKPYELC